MLALPLVPATVGGFLEQDFLSHLTTNMLFPLSVSWFPFLPLHFYDLYSFTGFLWASLYPAKA